MIHPRNSKCGFDFKIHFMTYYVITKWLSQTPHFLKENLWLFLEISFAICISVQGYSFPGTTSNSVEAALPSFMGGTTVVPSQYPQRKCRRGISYIKTHTFQRYVGYIIIREFFFLKILNQYIVKLVYSWFKKIQFR